MQIKHVDIWYTYIFEYLIGGMRGKTGKERMK